MKRGLVLSSVICLAIAGMALAEVRMGDTELGFTGSFLTENAGKRGGLDFDSWMLTGNLGYFLTDNIEVGGVGIFKEATEKWNATDTEVRMLKRDTNLYAFGGQAKYHFTPENQLVPYFGGQILWADLKVKEQFDTTPAANWERDKQGILWGPLAGLRYSLNEQNDLIVEYQYHIWANNLRSILEDGHSVMIGLSHRFK